MSYDRREIIHAVNIIEPFKYRSKFISLLQCLIA